MSKTEKVLAFGVMVAIILAITAFSFPVAKKNLGVAMTDVQTTVLTQLGLTDGLIVGRSGTGIEKMVTGTCNLISYSPTLSATSSMIYGCAATGVVSGDRVFVQAPRSSTGAGAVSLNVGGIFVRGASASTTSGFINVELANISGAASSSFPNATTSIQYWVTRS